jgi:hypothetical protein
VIGYDADGSIIKFDSKREAIWSYFPKDFGKSG